VCLSSRDTAPRLSKMISWSVADSRLWMEWRCCSESEQATAFRGIDILEDAREVGGLKVDISICVVDSEAIITDPIGYV
jgi:hypothetical protein